MHDTCAPLYAHACMARHHPGRESSLQQAWDWHLKPCVGGHQSCIGVLWHTAALCVFWEDQIRITWPQLKTARMRAGVSTHRRRSAPPEEWTVGCNGQVSPKPLHGNTPEPRGFYGGPTSIWSTTSAHAPIEGSWSPSIAAEWGRQPVGMSSDGSGLPTSDRHDSW